MPIIELQQTIPLARGASRLVYAHPGGPELLIKVMRPEVLARHRSNLAWKHRFKRARVLSVFIREIKEQLILDGKGEDSERFLQKVVGFCDTDLGVGMVVKAIRAADGTLAPSLKGLLEQGRVDSAVRRDLDRFCAALMASDVVFGKLKPGNLLYGTGEDGERRFVLIDGYGEGSLIPLKGAYRFLNRRSKQRELDRLRRSLPGARGESASAGSQTGFGRMARKGQF